VLGDAGLFSQQGLGEVALQAQPRDAMAQLLQEGLVTHQAMDGRGGHPSSSQRPPARQSAAGEGA